jgi:hypothetical protein
MIKSTTLCRPDVEYIEWVATELENEGNEIISITTNLKSVENVFVTEYTIWYRVITSSSRGNLKLL